MLRTLARYARHKHRLRAPRSLSLKDRSPLEGARSYGLSIDVDTTTFFIRRETLVPARVSAMTKWRTKMFIKLYESALEAAQFYRLPPGRVVELGSQTEI